MLAPSSPLSCKRRQLCTLCLFLFTLLFFFTPNYASLNDGIMELMLGLGWITWSLVFFIWCISKGTTALYLECIGLGFGRCHRYLVCSNRILIDKSKKLFNTTDHFLSHLPSCAVAPTLLRCLRWLPFQATFPLLRLIHQLTILQGAELFRRYTCALRKDMLL